MKRLLLICALLLLATNALGWVNLGPPSGFANALVVDPRSGALFAANPNGGIYRSADEGATWSLVFDAVARPTFIRAVAVDPETSRVYAANADSLLRSDDAGGTWTTIRSGLATAVTAVGNRVAISAADGLKLSADGGGTWSSIPSPAAFVERPRLLRLDPGQPSTLLVALGGRLFRTRNDGASWETLAPTNVLTLSFSDVLYAGGLDGVWRCGDTCTLIDDGPVLDLVVLQGTLFAADSVGVLRFDPESRERVSDGLPEAAVTALAATGTYLVAATQTGIFRSNDAAHWTAAGKGTGGTRVSAMSPLGGALFVATEASGLQRFAGGAWTRADAALPHPAGALPFVRALAPDGASLYAAMDADGIYRSDDGGTTWRDVTSSLPTRNVFAVAADSGVVYVSTARGMFLSPDRGATWSAGLAFDPAERIVAANNLVVTSDGKRVEVSRDRGTSAVNTNLPSAVTALAIAGSRIYAGTATNGVFFSDDGKNWTDPGAQTIVKALAARGGRAYAAIEPVDAESSLNPGVYATDDGIHWTVVLESEVLPRDIRALAADNATIYAATNSGVFAFLPARRRATPR